MAYFCKVAMLVAITQSCSVAVHACALLIYLNIDIEIGSILAAHICIVPMILYLHGCCKIGKTIYYII